MSTYHRLAPNIGIHERSNKLSLKYDDIGQCGELIEETSPEEMMKILLYGIKVCSYHMSTHDFNQLWEAADNWPI